VLTSNLSSGSLILEPVTTGGYFVEIVTGTGSQWWDYPGLLALQPWGVLSLPFLATVTMILVSVGVGLSVTVAIRLLLPVLRRRIRGANARSAATGAGIGSTPAITGLATLGACCCSTCATGGVAVVAAASGISVSTLLLNNWYLNIFELAVVYIALVAQERSLRQSLALCPVPSRLNRRMAAGLLLRLVLLVAGITWSIAMFVEWGSINPATASAALWYHWIFEHQLLSVTAVAAGMFPREFTSLVRRLFRRLAGVPGRVGLLAASLTWGIWVPPQLVGDGLGGFLNEFLGYLGAPASLGAVAPGSPLGAALFFHWAFQHLLLAAFGLALALAPQRATAPLLWSVGDARAPHPIGRPNPVEPAPGHPST
jgi:hypothetical protein